MNGNSFAPQLSDLRFHLREQVFRSTEWLTEVDIVRRSASPIDKETVQHWRTYGLIFALDMGDGIDRYPSYAFDPRRGYRPRLVMRPIYERFFAVKTNLGMAAWFASPNADLGNRRPLDLVAQAPDRVLTAARQVFRDIQHDGMSWPERNLYKAAGHNVQYGRRP